MKSTLCAATVACAAVVLALPARADTFYVALPPAGNDNSLGTENAPFATLRKANEVVTAGDTVLIRAGVYIFSGATAVGVPFTRSGSSGQPINYWAYPGEKPVFDFFGLNPQARITGFQIRASWLHFRGLELRGVQQILTDVNESWCIHVQGSNNVFEQLDLHHNEGPGLFIDSGGNNRVVNCDSHHNHDPDRGGENSDGFGCHSDNPGNVFTGCRAFWNSDDGFDFINSPGVCTVERSWAFYNGYVPNSTTAAGNGSGIKAGGFGLDPNTFPAVVPRHVVRFNVAFGNRASGFYANHHPGGIDWINNTAYDNPRNFDLLADVGAANHLLRNNLAVAPGQAIARQTAAEIDANSNSWSLSVTVSTADFVSVSESGVEGPRQPDGSLPTIDFLKLQQGSDLIDAGQDVGVAFAGSAPDLGAHEYGLAPPGGTGGTGAGGTATGGSSGTGTGGTAGTAGAGGAAGSSAGAGGLAGSAGMAGAAGAGASGAGVGGNSANGGTNPGGASGRASGSPAGTPGEESGCACRVAGERRGAPKSLLLAFAALGTALAARERSRARR